MKKIGFVMLSFFAIGVLAGCVKVGELPYGEESVGFAIYEGELEDIDIGTKDEGSVTSQSADRYALKHERIRGGNLSLANDTELTEEDFVLWHYWGINTLRINFNKDDFEDAYSDAPEEGNLWKPYENNIQKMENWVMLADKYDIQINVTLDHIWGDDHNSNALWDKDGDNPYLKHRLELSSAMAEWIKQYDNIQYLCPWNEMYPYDDIYHESFIYDAVDNIRQVNDDVTIVIMPPGAWGDIESFGIWDGLEDENTIYAVNLYDPYNYTHQGLYDIPLTKEGWPGYHQIGVTAEDTAYMDLETARDFLSVIKDFKDRTGKEVLVSEVGVIRWANGKEHYMSDILTILEEMEVGWHFHSIAGWNGWNPSYDAEDDEILDAYSGYETDLLKLLKGYWSKNIR